MGMQLLRDTVIYTLHYPAEAHLGVLTDAPAGAMTPTGEAALTIPASAAGWGADGTACAPCPAAGTVTAGMAGAASGVRVSWGGRRGCARGALIPGTVT